jgi:LysW-gamma-L-alpha-aminoadipyl-6-phosphate/LysW-L-glutamyl-5-phosphate reductase
VRAVVAKSANAMSDLGVAILGASGFGGGELLRYLSMHPELYRSDVQAISQHASGRAIASVHPHLQLHYPQRFQSDIDFAALANCKQAIVFAALAHGELAKLWPHLKSQLPAHCKVIDLSADFRLRTAADYLRHYRYEHPCPAALDDFVYAVPEVNADAIKQARFVANPGCFATAINLALLPLAHDADLCTQHIAISGITGSSGSGAMAQEGTHHPTRAHDFRAYKVLGHQHEAEIRQLLATQRLTDQSMLEFSFVPHSAPLVRGIFVTVQARIPDTCTLVKLQQRYADFYAAQPLVQLSDNVRLAAVVGSACAQLAVHGNERHFAVTCALDNLGKGMASQAIQNMNLMCGFAPESGLMLPAIYP